MELGLIGCFGPWRLTLTQYMPLHIFQHKREGTHAGIKSRHNIIKGIAIELGLYNEINLIELHRLFLCQLFLGPIIPS